MLRKILYNKDIFNSDYKDFFNNIFYSVSSHDTVENIKNYLDNIVIKKLNEVISDIKIYIETFSKSDYNNGKQFFDNLYKFLKNNMNNIQDNTNNINDSFIKYFKNIWEKEIRIFKNYLDNNQLFEDIWLSTPKLSQLKKILKDINEYNKNILENNNISNNEIAKYKSDRDRVIRDFWRNFIFDINILDSILQQNDIKSLELINEMLNRKEVIDHNVQGIYLYYVDQVKENLNDKKITKKQIIKMMY